MWALQIEVEVSIHSHYSYYALPCTVLVLWWHMLTCVVTWLNSCFTIGAGALRTLPENFQNSPKHSRFFRFILKDRPVCEIFQYIISGQGNRERHNGGSEETCQKNGTGPISDVSPCILMSVIYFYFLRLDFKERKCFWRTKKGLRDTPV